MAEKIKGITLEIGGDTTGLNAALKDINSQSRSLGSELAKVEKLLKLDPTNVELLAQKQELLSKQAELAAQKVEVLGKAQEEFDKAVADGRIEKGSEQYRAFQREVAAAQISADKATDALEDFEKASKGAGDEIEEAGKDTKKAGDDAEKSKSGWDKLESAASKVGSGLASVAKAAGTAVAAIGTALTAAAGAAAAKMAELTTGAAQYADDVATLSTQTGVAVETLQAYGYIQELVDVSTETLTGSMAKNIKSMSSAASGTGATAEAYKKLGVAIQNEDGTLRKSEDVYWDLIDALGKVEDTTERDALAMQILGKSAQDLNPLIETGSEQLGAMMQQAYDAGAVLSQDTLDALLGVSDAMETMKSSGEAVTNNLGALGATLMTDVYSAVTEVENAFSGMIAAVLNGGEITEEQTANIANAASKMVSNIAADLPQLLEAAKQIITALLSAAEQALPDILNTIEEAFPQIVDLLLSMLPTIIDTGISLFTALVAALPEIITDICSKLPEIIDSIIAALIELTPLLIDAGVALFVGIVSNMDEIINGIVGALPEIIKALVSGLQKAAPQMAEAGLNMIKGLWAGIKDAGAWLMDKISGFCSGIVNGIKELLGIHSPSTVFRDMIGKNMALGIGEGFSDEMDEVSKEMQDAIPTEFDIAVNEADRHSVSGGKTVRFDIVTPVSLGGKMLTNVVSRIQYDTLTGTARAIGTKATMPTLAEAL